MDFLIVEVSYWTKFRKDMIKINKKTERILLFCIVMISSLFSFVNLSKEGLANTYYAATVKSMTLNFKNFFYAALDPAGFVTVDKPAFGFWIQAIFAKILGFSGWSIILPQAISGVFSVILIYIILKKPFGSVAALISALLLAITPVFIAAGRNNTIDNQVVLVVLMAVWSISIAAREGKFKYLALCMIFIGIGFNIKMMQAYIVLPAIYVMYLFSNKISIKKRIIHLSIASIILLTVSFSWALVVDSVPSDNRPAIGSSDDNTMMGLILGYNGFNRLNIFGVSDTNMGNQGPGQMPGDGNNQDMDASDEIQGDNASDSEEHGRSGNKPRGNFPGGGNNFNGSKGGTRLSGAFGNQTPEGITRLFSKNMLSDQIVWFIMLAILSFVAVVIKEKIKFKLDTDKKQLIILLMFWFLPGFIYFSFNTGLFHPHYMTMIAPPIAALSGIGIVYMWDMYKEGGWKSWFLPVSIALNGIVHMLMLSYFYNSSLIIKILTVVVAVVCFVSVLGLIILKLVKNNYIKLKTVFLYGAIIGILITPTSGSAAVMFFSIDNTNPTAGLELIPTDNNSETEDNYMVVEGKPQMGMIGSQPENSDTQKQIPSGKVRNVGEQTEYLDDLVKFLNNNQVNGKNQIVVLSRNTAETLTLDYTDIYVGSLTGWGRNEKVMSIEKFKERIKNGEIRYVLANESKDGNMRDRNPENEIMTWVEENGELISYTDSSSETGENIEGQIYDLIDSVND